jgi:PBP1b-binding outer membrane lipoprotein LpoB
MKKYIVISILLSILLLSSCSNKEGNEGKEGNERVFQNQAQEKNTTVKINIKKEVPVVKNNTIDIKQKNEITKTISDIITPIEKEVKKQTLITPRIITIDAKKWEYSKKEIRVKK